MSAAYRRIIVALTLAIFAAPAVADENAKLTDTKCCTWQSVAIDGDTAVLGREGLVSVFIRDNDGSWSEQATLLPSDGKEDDLFGTAVAVDGDTIVVGAPFDFSFTLEPGSVYVYTRNDAGEWGEQSRLVPDDGKNGDKFGMAVAIDGDVMVIGAPFDDGFDRVTNSGSAYVYVRNAAGNWSFERKFAPEFLQNKSIFGRSVAIDGDTIVIGVPHYAGRSGLVYIYKRNWAGRWFKQARLGQDIDYSSKNRFGASVAIDNGTIAVGAPGKPPRYRLRRGDAYIYKRSGDGEWRQTAQLEIDDDRKTKDFDGLGSAIAIEGNTVVVGSSRTDDPKFAGIVEVFTRSKAGEWQHSGKLRPSDGGRFGRFGNTLAMDGNTVLADAYVFAAPVTYDAGFVRDLGKVNGNASTDFGVLFPNPRNRRNSVVLADGSSGKTLGSFTIDKNSARSFITLPDMTGDTVNEAALLLDGDDFARIHDPVTPSRLNRVSFSGNGNKVAFLAVGGVGGGPGPNLAVVGTDPLTGAAVAVVRNALTDGLVKRIAFDENYVPVDAVVLDNIAGSPAREIAVLGTDAQGRIKAEIRDGANGDFINVLRYDKARQPLAFAAVPDTTGRATFLAVLGRNESGAISATIKRVSDGSLVSVAAFGRRFEPRAFISFADSNASGGGEIAVVGVAPDGKVRAEVVEIADGTPVRKTNFSSAYRPVDAIAANGAAGTGRNEIVVLGVTVNGDYRLQIKDLLTGESVSQIEIDWPF